MEFTGSGSIAARLLLMLSFVLLFSMSSAHATPPPVQYPTITCSSPVSNPPPSYQGMPGEWNNSLRYGTGWEIDYYTVPGQTLPQLVVTWLTYDQSHRPIWLSAGPVPYDKTSLQWTAPMYKSTWAPNIGAGAHTVVQVGQVSIKFSNSSSTTAAIKWQWDEYSTTAWQPDECISNVESDSTGVNTALTAPTLGGIDQSYSGAWSDVTHSGWGLTEAVGLQPAGNVELQTLEIYDVAGNAVWLQAQNGPQSTPIPTSQISQTPPLWYYGSTYPVNTACSSSSCRGVEIQVGTANRTFTSNVAETFTVSVRQTTTLPGTQIGWPNSAFLFPNTSVNPVTYSPETTTSNLQKYAPIPYLYVSQTSCTLTGSQSTCPIVVSWTNTTDSTARVYEKSLTTGQYVIPSTNNDGSGCTPSPTQAISTAYTGSVKVCLPPSADVQFELHSGGSPSGTLLLTSPEVRVSAAQLPNSATFQSQTLSATNNTMQSGQTYNVSVTMLNSGQSTWTATAGYALAPITPAGNTNWVTTSVPLPTNTSVAPGGTYTFQFSVTAPYVASPPTYDFQWQMAQIVQGNSTFFGVPSDDLKITVNAAPLSATCGLEQIGGLTVNGGTIPSSNPVLTAGLTYAATVALKNTGSSTWTTAALDQLGSQYPAGNSIWVPGGVVALPGSIAPGATATFTFNIVAPTAGLYWYQWQMQQGSATPFGQICPPQYIQTVAPAIPLPPPAVTTSPASSTETTPAFNLTWGPGSTSANPAPTYYMLQYSTTPTGTPALINGNIPVTGSSNVYAVTMPVSGTYYFQVAACYPQGCSGFTESAAVVVTLPPTRPENVSVTQASASSDSFTLNWTQPTTVTPAASYSIQQATAATGPWTPASSAGTACTSGSCTSTITVTGPGTYYYEVAACAGASGTNCSVYARGTNVAKGGTASATSTYPGYPVSSIVDGDRTGYKWGNGGGWNSGTAGAFPDTATVTWTPAKTIQSVVVYTLQDNFFADVDPSDTMAFSAYGLTAFDVQVDTAGVWTTVATVTNSTLVKQTVTFPAVSATGVQIITHKAADGQYSRIVEVEALTLGSAVVTLPGYASTFVSQSVPSTMIAGQSYNVSVTMENTGTNTWTTATNYKLGSQNPQDNFTWGLQRVALPLNASITTGQIVTFSFTVVAPAASPIPYDFQWGTLQEGVTWFGSYSTDQKVTVSAASAPVPTAPAAPPTTTSILDSPVHDATVGTMAGQASTDGGAAQYTVPIVVPPGRDGMQPSLSLNYNSRSGNGVMGMGWNLSGLSSIHRCPSTAEQDGVALGVLYASTDKLCLDGQRLVAVNGQPYGVSGTEYRTEIDSYARITQVGGNISGGDVACFRVEQKDGRILHYGGITTASSCSITSADSRVKPGGAPAALSWLVEKMEDRVGNNQLYSYTDFTNGEVLLSSIAYTGFSPTNAMGTRTVNFAYEARSLAATGSQDISSSYLAGGLTMQTQALASITTQVSGATVRTYKPAYGSSTYNNRLEMVSLTECATDSNNTPQCHAPTVFNYNDGGLDYPFSPLTTINQALPTGILPYSIIPIGDLDGDGTREVQILALDQTDDFTYSYIAQIRADQSVQSVVDLSYTGYFYGPGYAGSGSVSAVGSGVYADIDGDGRTKLIMTPVLPPGATTPVSGVVSFGVWKGARGTSAASISGVTAPCTNETTCPQANFNALFQTVASNIAVTSSDRVYAQDMNGDGKPDIVVLTSNLTGCGAGVQGVYVYYNTLTTTLANATAPVSFQGPIGPLFCLPSAQGTGGTYDVTYQTIDHIADFNGDGIPDFIVTSNDAGTGASPIVGVYVTSRSGSGLSATLSATLVACGPSMNLTNADCQQTGSAGYYGRPSYYLRWMDVNGDGLEDLVKGSAGGTWMVHLNQGGTFASAIDTHSTLGLTDTTKNGSLRYANKLPPMDVDGDGKPDMVIPRATTLNAQGAVITSGFALRMCAAVAVKQLTQQEGCPVGETTTGAARPALVGPVSTLFCAAYACPEEPGAFDTAGNPVANLPSNTDTQSIGNGYPLVAVDENGNGHAAAGLYTSATFNAGPIDFSAYHLDMLKFVQTGPATMNVYRVPTALISGLNNGGSGFEPTDLAGNGMASIVTNIGCPTNPLGLSYSQGPGAQYVAACMVIGDGTYGPAALPDGTSAYTFQPVATSTAGVFSVASWLYANLNQGVAPAGAMTTAKATANSQLNGTAGCSVPVIFPGLLTTATNGLGDQATWGYDSLAEGLICTRDQAEYTVTGNQANLREYYFASSMPVVSAMLQSDGLGGTSGTRSMVYSYNQAMYNHFGRGFQGFEAISAENLSPYAKRRLVTTTQFNQDFPLTGKVFGTSTQPAPSSKLGTHNIHTELDSYLCTTLIGSTQSVQGICPGGNTLFPLPGGLTSTGTVVFQPVLTAQTTADFDLNSGAQSGHTSTSNTWDAYANLLSNTVTRSDDAAGGTFVNSHVVTTTNQFYPPSLSTWSINLPLQSTVTSTIAYASGHPLPLTAAAAGVTPSQTLTTNFVWNPDRTPSTKTVQPSTTNVSSGQTNPSSTTTYTYPSPSYGLPTEIQVNAPDLVTALSPTRGTTFTYTNNGTSASADGYFVYTTTRYPNFPALTAAQVTTTTHQTRDGQVLQTTDPNHLLISSTYDAFGRATQVQHVGNTGIAIESPMNVAYNSCAGGVCSFTCAGGGACAPNATNPVGEDGTEANAVYRVTTTQAGYPTKVNWVDALGRSVKQAEAGFSGTTSSALTYTFIASLTDYDQNGTMIMQSTPYQVGGTPVYSTFAYDALNRITSKTTPSSCAGTGAGTSPFGSMTTIYGYVGRQTNITASGSCTTGSNAAIYMSRNTNVLGQLMQTVDAYGNDSSFTHGQVTSYWTEPQGHVAAMTDVEGNSMYALYNALGQRLLSHDPDQGQWSYIYDAFGELVSQTDARSAVTAILARDALGRTTQQTETPPSTLPAGMTSAILYDTWSYDPLNGIGEIKAIARQRGTNATNPSANPQVWQETTSYDPLSARPTSIATVITEGGSAAVTLNTGMSYDSAGHLSTQTYPSGLVVAHGYTAYGQENELSNATTGYVYWTAQAQNEWKHITQEQYPGLITGVHADAHSTGQAQTLSWSGTTADEFDYQYDSFGNLNQQIRSKSAGYTETYQYDALQRLTSANRNGTAVTYNYSPSGNLKTKSDYSAGTTSDYTYGGSGCGPHAATSVNLTGSTTITYACDANGNVIGGGSVGSLALSYDADNRPWVGSRALGIQDNWVYSPSGQLDYVSSSRGARYYGPMGYEQNGTLAIHELGPVIVTRNGSADTISVVLRDRLGSTVNVIDNNVPTTRSYDAFGKPIAGNGNLLSPAGLGLTDTIHGFTKHEHDDDLLLINMVGRLYDYQLGRFLSVDPIIGNPSNGQSLNPYSYIGNNPLSGTDPTGYQACTGSNVQHDSCESPTLSVTPGSGPSVSDAKAMNDAIHSGPPAPSSSGSSVQGSAVQGSANQAGSSINTASSNATQPSVATPASNAPQSVVNQAPTLSTVSVTGSIGAGLNSFVGSALDNLLYALNSILPSEEAQERAEFYKGEIAKDKAEAVNSSHPVTAGVGYVLGSAIGITTGAATTGDVGEIGEIGTLTRLSDSAGTIRNGHLAGDIHPQTGIPFNSAGYPDFSGVMKAEVEIIQTGSRAGDYRAANKAAGFSSTPEGYTWHHHENGTTMQLVPRDVHAQTGHTGGFSPSGGE